MTATPKARTLRLQLYHSPDHPCSYLSGRAARMLSLDPEAVDKQSLYGSLINYGFRRSGEMIYRPDCPQCDACIPARIPVNRFQARRSQRRIWKRAIDRLETRERPARFDPAHYELFSRYVRERHPEGEMANTSKVDYLQFVTSGWCETRFIELIYRKELLAVAVTDYLPQGLSALYTFFDPERSELSPGVLSLLWQIEHTKRLGLPWLYLGYWIEGCRKMAYKIDYRPLEIFVDSQWVDYTP